MEITPWLKLQERLKQVSFILFGSFILNVLLIFLTIYTVSHKVVTIELPPVPLKDTLVVQTGEANQAFFETWGKYIVAIAGTYSPESIEDVKYTLMQRVHPESYAKMESELTDLTAHVIKNRVRQSFYPNWKRAEMEILNGYARWTVPGKSIKEVGGDREEESVQYILKMMVDGIGGFYLVDIGKKEGR
jgi:hypothetical protein